MSDALKQPLRGRGLLAAIMLIVVVLMLIGGLLVFIPTLTFYRTNYLDQRLLVAHLALKAAHGGDEPASSEATGRMLAEVGISNAWVNGPQLNAQFGPADRPAGRFDLRQTGPIHQFVDTLDTMVFGRDRPIDVVARSPLDGTSDVEIVINEKPLRQALLSYAWRKSAVSLFLLAILGFGLILILQRMFVLPMTDLAAAMTRFRRKPDDTSQDREPSARKDEIGIVEREFAAMRDDVRLALTQRRRLAALGAAVAEITHDLRNILSAAFLLSDRLEASKDPVASDVGSKLIGALDRAVRLCADATSFARGQRTTPKREVFPLRPLAEEVRETLAASGLPADAWTIQIDPDLTVFADRSDLFRVLLAITRNARDATREGDGRIEVTASANQRSISIYVSDDGKEISAAQRTKLFDLFIPRSRPGDRGLGLVACREIMHAHGGEIELVESSPGRTTFRLVLPAEGAGSAIERAEAGLKGA